MLNVDCETLNYLEPLVMTDNLLTLMPLQLFFKVMVLIAFCRILLCSQVLLGKYQTKFGHEKTCV